jgi:hypothetical protein
MKNFSTLKYLVTTLVLASMLVSCGKKNNTDTTTDDSGLFFNIVYYTVASRSIGTSGWTTAEGKQRYKFNSDVDSTGTATGTGTFVMQYDAYREPQLFNAGTCSGGYSGSFSFQQATTVTTPDTDAPYDPSTPYSDGSTGTSDPFTGNTDPGTTTTNSNDPCFNKQPTTFVLSLSVEARSLSSGCTAYAPQDAFELRVIRYCNGDLVITNASRTMDFYAQPELVQ